MRRTRTSNSTQGSTTRSRRWRPAPGHLERTGARRRLGFAVAVFVVAGTATASTVPLSTAAAGEPAAAAQIAPGLPGAVAAAPVATAPKLVAAAEQVAAGPVLAANAPIGTGTHVQPVAPTRLLGRTTLAAGATTQISVPNVPSGATAALLNVTVDAGTAATTVSACASTSSCSVTSAVPAPRGRVTPGQVLAPISNGKVTIRNHTATADVFVDLVGYVQAPGSSTGVVVPVEPRRVLSWHQVGAGGSTTLKLPSVPRGATAVVIDIGYAAATERSYVSACAAGTAVRDCARTSVLNPDPAVNRSNAVVVPLGGAARDSILLYNNKGSVRLNADVQAYVVPAAASGEGLRATMPTTVVDRTLSSGASTTVTLPSVPTGVTGALVHVTAKNATGGASVAVCPGSKASTTCLGTSVLNPFPGAASRTLAYVGVAKDGKVTVANTANKVDVEVQLVGYVVAPTTAAAVTGGTSGGSTGGGSTGGDTGGSTGGSGGSTGGGSSGGSTGGGSTGGGSTGGGSAGGSTGGSTSSGKPNDATTGVPDGISLTRHDGDLIIKQDGTVIENMDVHGFISIRAANVTIRNSIVRGSGPGSYSTGLISCLDAKCRGAVIDHVTLVPKTPSPWITGILGHDYTARNVDVYHTVDGFGIFDTNDPNGNVDVVIENSWCHDLAYFAKDPQQNNGPSHNDCIQIQGGGNVRIVGNRLDAFMSTKAGDQSYDARNRGAGLMVTPNVGPVTGAVVRGNWFDGGYASAHFQANKFSPMRFGTFAENKFGRNQYDYGRGSKYQIRVKPGVSFDNNLSTNVWEDGSGPLVEGRDGGIRYE